jgi:hypothetical protein
MSLSADAVEAAVNAAEYVLDSYGVEYTGLVVIVDSPVDIQLGARPEDLREAMRMLQEAFAVLQAALAQQAGQN